MKNEKILLTCGILMALIGIFLLAFSAIYSSKEVKSELPVSSRPTQNVKNRSENTDSIPAKNQKSGVQEQGKNDVFSTEQASENESILPKTSEKSENFSKKIAPKTNISGNDTGVKNNSEKAKESAFLRDLEEDAFLNSLNREEHSDAITLLRMPLREVSEQCKEENATRFQIPSDFNEDTFIEVFQKYAQVKCSLLDTFYP